MAGRSAGYKFRGRGVPGIDRTKVATVHFRADAERPVRKLERPRPARALRWRIDPELFRDGGVAAEHRPSRAALRFHRPACTPGDRGRVLKQSAHEAGLPPQIDSEMIDERLRRARLRQLFFFGDG